MSTKIRLQRHGKKKYPFYHIVIADERSKRDGRFIEKIGTYNPNVNPATIDLDFDRALHWLQDGAVPTDTARAILSYKGVMLKNHLDRGVIKGALTQAEADKKFDAWTKEKEAKISGKAESVAKASADEEAARLAGESTKRENTAKAVAEKAAAAEAAESAPAEEAAEEGGEVAEGEEAPAEEAAPEAEAKEEAPAEEAAPEAEAKEEAPAEEAAPEAEAKEEAPAEEAAPEAEAKEEAPAEEAAPEAEAKEEAPAEEAAPEAEEKPEEE